MKFIGVSAVLVFVSSFVWVLLEGKVATSSIMWTDPVLGWALNLFVSFGASLLVAYLAVMILTAIRIGWLNAETDRKIAEHLQDEFGLSVEDARSAVKVAKEQQRANQELDNSRKISDAADYLNKNLG